MQRRQARIVASCSSHGSQRRKKKGQAVGQNMRLGRVNLHIIHIHSYPSYLENLLGYNFRLSWVRLKFQTEDFVGIFMFRFIFKTKTGLHNELEALRGIYRT